MSHFALSMTYDTSVSNRALGAYMIQAFPTEERVRAVATQEPTWNNRHRVTGIVKSEAEAVEEIARFVTAPLMTIFRAVDYEGNAEIRVGDISVKNTDAAADGIWREITVLYRRSIHGTWQRHGS